ncbi:NUDIX domain-containing protein [Chelativorans salis]|uniref:NUDIX domain-containing protein n=1 Tax=Chelativorans salis TaxID=2978478 RepID=A0ABT2LJJ7_9HYPH|nr:NUDIX domain-containing protein [Chelativorans sp. EGI FJ00035]MCT7374770.1 NUDIX domain-containing protein [Chelativorans sp. EGI FJ00035]
MSARRLEPRPAEKTRLIVRLFHLWFLFRRPMTLGVRGVVYDTQARTVLLVRHTYVAGWQLPGGGVEPGETMEAGLARELEEEGNIALAGAPELKSVHFNRQASRRDHVAVYLVANFRQTRPHTPDGEIAEARFFSLDALPEETTEATRRRLAEIFEGVPVSAEW